LFSFDRSICERIGQTLLNRLLIAEKEWKQQSSQWQRKIQQWELWKSQAKDRAREFERLRKAQKVPKGGPVRLDPLDQPDTSWEASFHPNDPLPAFSFAGMGKYPREELDEDIRELARWSGVSSWILSALKRGIAIHHSGMNKAYRSLIERYAFQVIS
jgi:superfamily II RNA helicase